MQQKHKSTWASDYVNTGKRPAMPDGKQRKSKHTPQKGNGETMASLNKVMLIGCLGKDPEIRTTPGGAKKAAFSMATSEKFKDKNTGEYRDKTEWHNIVVWNQLADVVEKLGLRKGISVFVEGKITQRSWDDQQSGQKRYATEIVAERLQVLTPREKSSGSNGGNYGADYGSDQAPAQADDLPF